MLIVPDMSLSKTKGFALLFDTKCEAVKAPPSKCKFVNITLLPVPSPIDVRTVLPLSATKVVPSPTRNSPSPTSFLSPKGRTE